MDEKNGHRVPTQIVNIENSALSPHVTLKKPTRFGHKIAKSSSTNQTSGAFEHIFVHSCLLLKMNAPNFRHKIRA